MLVITLANTVSFTSLSYVDAFVVSQLFSYTVADWWVTTFGAPDESLIRVRPLVLNVRVNNIDYTEVDTYAECLALEGSWFLGSNAFFVHMDHDVVWEGVVTQYGNGAGFTDQDVVYVDDIEYLPLITQAPQISRSEDVQGYQKLRLVSGGVSLGNNDGRLDYLKDSSVIGNEARLSYLNRDLLDDGAVTAADLVPQATYFVEESEYGNDVVGLSLQDNRKLDVIVPTRTFDPVTYPFLANNLNGKLVPLVYGACRSVKGIPVNSKETGTLSATFRVGELLSSITEVRLKIGETWTVTSTSSTDLANGTFTITTARAGTGQDPYECQADVVGIEVVNAPDSITDLYDRFVNQAFDGTFYDTAAWTENKAAVPTCGLLIDKATPILEIIPVIQNGVYPSFRFDTTPLGKKTIKLDDKARAVDWFVDSVDILNIDSMRPSDISDFLFGRVTVQYDQDRTDSEYKRVTVETYDQEVKELFQWSNSTTLPTLLTTEADAQTMVDAKALEFSVPIRTMPVTLMGDRYYEVELFDIMQIDTAFGRDEYLTEDFDGREFLGVIVCQVIGLAPGYENRTIDLTLKILDRDPEPVTFTIILAEDESILTTEDDALLVGP